ncbi:hypothetical protein FXE20_07405 [Vibrio cholerae]|nr:hypothetical protein [Vibrio cholerae]EGR2427830.1 hypothetical protein [Vibrio cholerae]EGR3920771.1 hypothetical protein [Vibrio cholerae]TXZ72015.1 hypothetical protein FXE20_07405 [Vibrio cholerae]
MPIPLKPYKIVCPQCNWILVRAPKSDVLSPLDLPKACPQCGCESLNRQAASMVEKMLAELFRKF